MTRADALTAAADRFREASTRLHSAQRDEERGRTNDTRIRVMRAEIDRSAALGALQCVAMWSDTDITDAHELLRVLRDHARRVEFARKA